MQRYIVYTYKPNIWAKFFEEFIRKLREHMLRNKSFFSKILLYCFLLLLLPSNNKRMSGRYDILEFVSQRENREMPLENEDLVHIANLIRRAADDSGKDEGKPSSSPEHVICEKEKREAERIAKESGSWTPFSEIFTLGIPGPSGSESDTYIAQDGYIYKTNNLMHCRDSIVLALQKYILYNVIFPDSAYTHIGFTGFDGRSVYPIFRQKYIKDCTPALQNEIDCYMAALGFEKTGNGRFENSFCTIWDVLPKNVLKDPTGDPFVIDAEIALKH